MPQDQYQTVRDTAKPVEVAGVRRWIKEGQRRATGIGKVWRIADSVPPDFQITHQTPPRLPLAGLSAGGAEGDAACRN